MPAIAVPVTHAAASAPDPAQGVDPAVAPGVVPSGTVQERKRPKDDTDPVRDAKRGAAEGPKRQERRKVEGPAQAAAGTKLVNPLPGGARTSEFGEVSAVRGNRPHGGTDLAKATGTPIKAAAAGKVVLVGSDGDGYGNYLTIDHGNGWFTRYAHASKIEVKQGETVQAGDVVAKVGSTGNSTGPHLHFEVLKGGTGQEDRVDPAPFLAGKQTF